MFETINRPVDYEIGKIEHDALARDFINLIRKRRIGEIQQILESLSNTHNSYILKNVVKLTWAYRHKLANWADIRTRVHFILKSRGQDLDLPQEII